MTKRSVCALLLVLATAALPVFADDALSRRADEFATELKSGKFDEAARSFHYPETYTPAELAADQKSVADGLRSLFLEIGDVENIAKEAMPAGEFLFFGISGGDVPYWNAHAALNRMQNVVYRAHVKHDGEIFFVVSLIQPKAEWETRMFTFRMLASRPNAAKRMGEIASKVFGAPPGGMPTVPNPSVNADAPVRAGNLASRSGGAPVTLYR